jgi:hypothetical protein
MCVVPFLNGFFSSYWILPSALTMSLSRQIAGLVTYRLSVSIDPADRATSPGSGTSISD